MNTEKVGYGFPIVYKTVKPTQTIYLQTCMQKENKAVSCLHHSEFGFYKLKQTQSSLI